MKKNLFLFIVFGLLIFLLAGCGDTGGSGEGSGIGNESGSGGSSEGGSGEGSGGENGVENDGLDILVIGDISSTECTEYLAEALRAVGEEKITLACLVHNNSTGASLSSQWTNISEGKKVYNLIITEGGRTDREFSKGFDEVLSSRKWDYVIIGQAVQLAGIEEEYARLADVVSHINAGADEARILWNMTWAFNSDSTHTGFEVYGRDQAAMYAATVNAVKEYVIPCTGINGIIPLGTVIQNMRGALSEYNVTGDGLKLKNDKDCLGTYAAAMAWCHAITAKTPDAKEWLPEDVSDMTLLNRFKLVKECVMNAIEDKFEVKVPDVKSIKLLIFGNSYGNDATAYLGSMLAEGGYSNIVIGHAGESSMTINDHYHNIDDDPDNDYIYSNGKPFSVHYKTVNGESVQMEADYKAIVADEDWDYVIFYQGPNSMNTLISDEYYSELGRFVDALRANMTNPDGKIVYYMPWIHGETNTVGYYGELVELTQRLFLSNPDIDGIIPAATLIQNLRTSYLDASATTEKWGDINRDWGHLNYGVGRYSMALLFYAYLSGGNIEDITYIPTANDIAPSNLPRFTAVEENIDVIREAIKNALEKPFEITESVYTERPGK